MSWRGPFNVYNQVPPPNFFVGVSPGRIAIPGPPPIGAPQGRPPQQKPTLIQNQSMTPNQHSALNQANRHINQLLNPQMGMVMLPVQAQISPGRGPTPLTQRMASPPRAEAKMPFGSTQYQMPNQMLSSPAGQRPQMPTQAISSPLTNHPFYNFTGLSNQQSNQTMQLNRGYGQFQGQQQIQVQQPINIQQQNGFTQLSGSNQYGNIANNQPTNDGYRFDGAQTTPNANQASTPQQHGVVYPSPQAHQQTTAFNENTVYDPYTYQVQNPVYNVAGNAEQQQQLQYNAALSANKQQDEYRRQSSEKKSGLYLNAKEQQSEKRPVFKVLDPDSYQAFQHYELEASLKNLDEKVKSALARSEATYKKYQTQGRKSNH